MKLRIIISTFVILLALIFVVNGNLVGSPASVDGAPRHLILQLEHSNPLPQRDDADQIVFQEDFENNAEGWTTSDIAPVYWHKSDFTARGENDLVWWCGDTLTDYDPDYVGYENNQIQWIKTPVLDLSGAGDNLELTFAAKWLVEDPRRVPGGLNGMDAWDGWLVMISTNGGDSFEPIRPVSPEYTAEHISAGERFHALGGSWPGWTFESKPDGRDGWEAVEDTVLSPEWLDCTFDLSDYVQENVVIKFQLLSDLHVASPWNYYLGDGGVWIDDLLIIDADNTVFLSNNGTDDPVPSELIPGQGLNFIDTWALNGEDVHAGNASMWNDDDNFGVWNTLDSPSFEVPVDFNTHLEFWVHCDLPDSIYRNGEGALCDFYQIFTSDDGGETWNYLIHDYNRDEAGGDGWVHYVPGIHWNPDVTNLDLTPYAGSEIQLRWLFRCDFNHIGSNGDVRDGSGLFIDDIQVIATNQQPRDAGFENLYIPYPTTVRSRTAGLKSTMYNYGSRDLTQIWSYWGWYNGDQFSRALRIIPNPTINSGDSTVINITDYADRQNPGWTPLYPGAFTVFTRTAVGSATPADPNDDDQYTGNDSLGVSNVRVWPSGIFELGYDNRSVRFPVQANAGTGIATRFSPGDIGLENYSIAFANFRFNGIDNPATFRLHVRAAGQDQNTPGADLVAFDVEVSPDSTLPGRMTVDLSDRDELQNLQGDFWLWAEVTGNDGQPKILADELRRGEGRYFGFNGNQASAFNGDVAMYAAVIPANNEARNLAASEALIDFGEVVVNESEVRLVGLYSTGLLPVTVTSVRSTSEDFEIDFPGEVTLRTGEALWMPIVFTAPDFDVHSTDLIIESNDESNPAITIIGSGTEGVGDELHETPLAFGLDAAYPNPFNSTTRLNFALATTGRYSLTLFDLAGRQISVVAEGRLAAGRHSTLLEASALPAGLYIVRLQSGQSISSQKILLIK